MKLYRLPPAGNRVHWSERVDACAVRGLFAPWEPAFFGSGTAALAALLTALRQRTRRTEVILGAYNCPDLISAVLHAGCHPKLVDLAPGTPWMDLQAVEARLGRRTLAIAAVDMFGLSERHGALRELAERNGSFLVQDSAQGFPLRAGDKSWQGDAVIISFGRGKPVSLLAGGAVLCRDRQLAQEVTSLAAERSEDEARHARRVRAYNLLRHPRLYWLPAAVPSLHLGETRFEPLPRIDAMPAWLTRRVPPAVAAYRARGRGTERQYAAMAFGRGIIDVARACGVPPGAPLSRYPLLASDGVTRDRFCSALAEHGVSPFYGVALPEVAGLEKRFGGVRDGFPVARDFAARLFTLPTHDGVRQRDIAAIGRALCGAAQPAARTLRESAG